MAETLFFILDFFHPWIIQNILPVFDFFDIVKHLLSYFLRIGKG